MLLKRTRNMIVFTVAFMAVCCVFAFSAGTRSRVQAASKQSVLIKYNGKKVLNTSQKLPVLYNKKKVTKTAYMAMSINGNYMAPYADVLKNGAGASCKYSSSSKKLTITYGENTLEMKVGKKSASLNGTSIKLPAAPLSVQFVEKGKTKILVPLKSVAKRLGMTFFKTGEQILLRSPLSLQYSDGTTSYFGVQGDIYYNKQEYTLKTLPVVKINEKYYIPAEEVVRDILKLDYSYDDTTGELSVINEDTGIHIKVTAGSDQAELNGTAVSLGAPALMIKDLKTDADVLCLPAAAFLKTAGYTRGWDKAKCDYSIQSKSFFSWSKDITNLLSGTSASTANTATGTAADVPAQSPANGQDSATESTNYIYAMSSVYSETKSVNAVKLQVHGSSMSCMDKISIKRDKQQITVTIPSSQYVLDKNQFSNFGMMIEKLDVVADAEKNVLITLTCNSTLEYSYTIQNGVLELNIIGEKPTPMDMSSYSLAIPKPEGVVEDDVTNKDLYPDSKAFKIYIKGDHTDFLHDNPVVIDNNSAKKVSVSLTSGGNTAIKIKTSQLRGYKIYVKDDYIYVFIDAPRKIYKSIVVLDAGHGGYDSGATNNGKNEKDINFNIIYKYLYPYFSGNAPDIKAYWTRTTDKFISLEYRSAFAKKVDADIFISLHQNSASNTSANGTEVYYSVSNNSTGFSGISSQIIAAHFKDLLVDNLNMKNRGTKTAAYYVLKHNTVPSVLIELGFLSGNVDYSKITKTSFQKNAAKSIYDGIAELFNEYPTGR